MNGASPARRMSQRTLAGLIAGPLVVLLLVLAWVVPLPYVVYRPGLTVDVLGKAGGKPIVQVSGHPSYADGGQLRMTTVSVSRPDADVTLPELLGAWLDRSDAVYPWDAVYQKGVSSKQDREEGAAQMASSKDHATAAALHEMGVTVPEVVTIAGVAQGQPADGVLETGDVVLRVDGKPVSDTQALTELIRATPPGGKVTLDIRRDGTERSVAVAPVATDGTPRIGVTLEVADYTFPFDVDINIDQTIGGPSAGLMFSLAIYDVLTPGSLTDGQAVAGTGEIGPDGQVGPIGGIQQKIAAADRDGAHLFLVPDRNCADALGAQHDDDLRLVRVATMHDALQAIEDWTDDHDATLPSCSTDNGKDADE